MKTSRLTQKLKHKLLDVSQGLSDSNLYSILSFIIIYFKSPIRLLQKIVIN